MISRSIAVRLTGVAIAMLGSAIWASRLDYSPETTLIGHLGGRLIDVDPNRVSDLSSTCSEATKDGGWMLFILNANLRSDSTTRTFFETADERFGLWVEYDPGLLRLGQGLGAESLVSNTEIPIRWVRRDESAFIAIAVTADGTRVVSNAVDKRNKWPGTLMNSWRCDKVQIGSDTRELSEGRECLACNARLRYASGQGVQQLEILLDNLSNVQSLNLRRWTGTGLILLGISMTLHGQRRRFLLMPKRRSTAGHRESATG